jgi:threonine aldolase
VDFTSDNAYGVSPAIMRALERANQGAVASYGEDELSAEVEAALSRVFEREVAVFQVVTGTAANALSIAAFTPPFGAVLCHEDAHIMSDECGAPEFYSAGAKLIGLPGAGCKLDPAGLIAALARMERGNPHHTPPAMLSLTQSTEAGTVYRQGEIAELCRLAHDRGLAVHMDGARFANALVSLEASPAEITWKAGVDVLSFGATKNGAMAAEAVVLFSPEKAQEIEYRRKRAGHLMSKSRFIAVQLLAYLEDGLWLDTARYANRLAAQLGAGLAALPGVRLAWPVEANEVFALLPRDLDVRLRAAGARYHPWQGRARPEGGMNNAREVLVRLVTSGAMEEGTVTRLLENAAQTS